MIKCLPFKRALLMPTSRRPRVSFLNNRVRGDAISSDGFITTYPRSSYFHYVIRSRYRSHNPR